VKYAKTIPACIYRHVQAHPERECIHFRDLGPESFTDETLSYGELWTRSAAMATQLDFLEPNQHVIIVMPLGPQLLIAQLAVLLGGGIASIFTHPSEKIVSKVYAEKLKHAVSAFHPRAIVTMDVYLDEVRQAIAGEPIKIILFCDGQPLSPELDSPWKLVAPDGPAIIQYSSGSTGLQKAVALTHDMVLTQCESYARSIELSAADDRICSWLPLYHDMGLFTSWLMPVLHGTPVSLIDPFLWVKQPQSLLRLITDVEGSLCWQPNFAFNLLAQRVRAELLEGLDLRSMRGFVNCSEPVSAASLRDFQSAFSGIGLRRTALWSCYAMAENSFGVSSAIAGSALDEALRLDAVALGVGVVELCGKAEGIEVVSCGRPIPGTEVFVVDPENGSTVDGRIGELVLKSDYMLREYYRNPELTNAAISKDGRYRTGDLGFLRAGNVYVTGRKKDLLIVGGRNFYPQDIERIADRFDGVVPGRAVALGVKDERLGTEKVILLIETRLENEAKRSQLGSEIRKAVFDELDCPLADIRLLPHTWLLKTSSGKIARLPNLTKYQAEFIQLKPALESIARGVDSTVCWQSLIFWSLVLSVTMYLAILISAKGANQSWNVYMRF
jgi:acyl-CoA synthetase (AMP-forming)/AMP-acid ligase II